MFERNAFSVVFREPSLGGLFVGEDLEIVGVPDTLACIHVNEHCHLTIL
jgi:hypothetical protein